MENNIQSIRGMNDYLPEEIQYYQYIEEKLKIILNCYNYKEIRFPIVEKMSLFKRAIGTVTDIVEKEMYSFEDRNGEILTLRPEGTACCVRAGIEHGLFYNKVQRLWYLGPMFRYERPQRGRFRQFYQLGVEVFGKKSPHIDAEVILIIARFWKILEISEYLSLELNSIGSLISRTNYIHALKNFFKKNLKFLDKDSIKRLNLNPLRILDSKNSNIKELLNNAPLLSKYLDPYSKEHFSKLCKFLDLFGISYKINPRLVRGLDYYNNTVFEWITNNRTINIEYEKTTICAGGRYDGLVEMLGGNSTPAVGFALGIERLVNLLKIVRKPLNLICSYKSNIDIYLINIDDSGKEVAMLLAEKIRDFYPKLRTVTGNGNLKKQLSKADKYGAIIALILGKNELKNKKIIIKHLKTRQQKLLLQTDLTEEIELILKSQQNHIS